MAVDYTRCKVCNKKLPEIASRRQYKISCSKCVKTKPHILNTRDLHKGLKPSVFSEDEQFFEDDPRALKEKDYGRYIPITTSRVNTKTEID